MKLKEVNVKNKNQSSFIDFFVVDGTYREIYCKR